MRVALCTRGRFRQSGEKIIYCRLPQPGSPRHRSRRLRKLRSCWGSVSARPRGRGPRRRSLPFGDKLLPSCISCMISSTMMKSIAPAASAILKGSRGWLRFTKPTPQRPSYSFYQARQGSYPYGSPDAVTLAQQRRATANPSAAFCSPMPKARMSLSRMPCSPPSPRCVLFRGLPAGRKDSLLLRLPLCRLLPHRSSLPEDGVQLLLVRDHGTGGNVCAVGDLEF